MAEETNQKQEAGWRSRLPRIFGDGDEGDAKSPGSGTGFGKKNAEEVADLENRLQEIQNHMERMAHLVESINERETAQERVFNTLHTELRDYKKDFIYEHLKPIVRPLLFLHDSLEQFDLEVKDAARKHKGSSDDALSPKVVRENVRYFRDQLVEALRICEVTPMETPRGKFNPKLQKVIDVVPVKKEHDGEVQRVIRSGWCINQQVLRSAEVIVGKHIAK